MVEKNVHSPNKSCNQVRVTMCHELLVRVHVLIQRYSYATQVNTTPHAQEPQGTTHTKGRHIQRRVQDIEKQERELRRQSVP